MTQRSPPAIDRVGRRRLGLAAGILCALGLLAAPRVFHQYDVVDCFLAWSQATQGLRPWGAYTPGVGADDCDYPPLVPYVLTWVEATRRTLGVEAVSPAGIVLLKLPALAAQAAFAWCALGLAPLLGGRWTLRLGLALVLSPALFVNTALWGQFDVPLALFMAAAAIALLLERPVAAGAWAGVALGTKLLAVVPLPLLAVFVWRRHGARALGQSIGAGLLAIAVLALPHVAAGRGRPLAAAYAGAVSYYPLRSAEAYNTWYLLDRYDVLVRGLPPPEVRRDDRPALGPLTYRDLGLSAFGAFTLLVLAVLWRRPTPRVLLWCLAVHLLGFFMLPTQVHQRYIVPAVVFLGLLAPWSRTGLAAFAAWSVTATLNQGLDLVRALPATEQVAGALTTADLPLSTRLARDLGAGVAIVNVLLFVWIVVRFWRETRRPDGPEGSDRAGAGAPA